MPAAHLRSAPLPTTRLGRLGAAERLLDMQLRCCSCSQSHPCAMPAMIGAPNLADGESAGGRTGTVLCARNHSAGRTALLLGLRRLRRMIRTSRESTPVLLAASPLPVWRGHAHELTLARERRPIDRGAMSMLVSMLAAGWIGIQKCTHVSVQVRHYVLRFTPLDRCVHRAGEPARANGLQCQPCPQLQV